MGVCEAAGNDATSPLSSLNDWDLGRRWRGSTEVFGREVDSKIRGVQGGVVLGCRKAFEGHGQNQALTSGRGSDSVIRTNLQCWLVARNHSDIRAQAAF